MSASTAALTDLLRSSGGSTWLGSLTPFLIASFPLIVFFQWFRSISLIFRASISASCTVVIPSTSLIYCFPVTGTTIVFFSNNSLGRMSIYLRSLCVLVSSLKSPGWVWNNQETNSCSSGSDLPFLRKLVTLCWKDSLYSAIISVSVWARQVSSEWEGNTEMSLWSAEIMF